MTPTPDREPDSSRRPADRPGSPYGPQPRGADEAAGGADSSPFENESSDNRPASASGGGSTPDPEVPG